MRPKMRGKKPLVFSNLKQASGADEIVAFIKHQGNAGVAQEQSSSHSPFTTPVSHRRLDGYRQYPGYMIKHRRYRWLMHPATGIDHLIFRGLGALLAQLTSARDRPLIAGLRWLRHSAGAPCSD